MKYTIITSNKKAFSLIELLVTISIIIVLAGYYTTSRHKAEEQMNILATKHLLTKVAEALHSFQRDWGEFPPNDLGYLFAKEKMKKFASDKGIEGKGAYTPYIDYTITSNKMMGWCCRYYFLYKESYANKGYNGHRHGALTPTEICNGHDWETCYTKKCTRPCNVFMTFSFDYGSIPYADGWAKQAQSAAMVDKWDNILYYKKNSNGGFFLMSAGPDGKATPDLVTFMQTATFPESYSKSGANNSDNIIYGSY